eukprot:Tamp_10853.p1 GENE.Tamp_10853~~Tamp_10853.p1  ORF type:complete len:241 (+),score=46.56 Tamp_10853:38-724(+)
MVQVQQRIEDAALREQTFERRKHELIRQAMELSILCDCDVQLFVHSAKVRVPDARARPASTQFSSDNAEALMAYVREHPPAERFGVEDYWHKFKEGGAPPDGDGAARPPLPPHPAGPAAVARAGEGHSCWAPAAELAAARAAAAAAVSAGSGGPLVRPVPSAGVCQRAAKAPPRWVPPHTLRTHCCFEDGVGRFGGSRKATEPRRAAQTRGASRALTCRCIGAWLGTE